jgi:hypothetical protein
LNAVKEVEMLKPNARRSPGCVTNALYFYLRVLALHLVRLVVELDGGEARVGGRAIWFLGRELERAERLVAPDLELRDPRREPACAVRARCVRGACARPPACDVRWRASVWGLGGDGGALRRAESGRRTRHRGRWH